jgi:hypothetical protein
MYRNLKQFRRDQAIRLYWKRLDFQKRQFYYKLAEADSERHARVTLHTKRKYIKKKQWPVCHTSKGKHRVKNKQISKKVAK